MAFHSSSGKLKTRRPILQFHLVRFFSFGAIVMFLLVAFALIYFENKQIRFFSEVQNQQNTTFQQVQKKFATLQEQVGRRDLLAIHESGNANLTRLFSNALWESYFAPFVALATKIPLEGCRSIANVTVDGKIEAPPQKKLCYDQIGEQVLALKGFADINTRVFEAMAKSSVLKIKVFDTRGLTVYSSDHSQIGDDKINNTGWQSAVKGVPASTLTHRGKFDSFEGTLVDRDVISSYQAVYQPGTDIIVGVFEVYSDVTQFLATINNTSSQIRQAAEEEQTRMAQIAFSNQGKVEQSSTATIVIVLAILILLFGGLFLIVRRAGQIIDRQSEDREKTQQHLAQTEKMASLGQMVAGVTHQLNTPIAFSHNNINMALEALDELKLPLNIATQFTRMVNKYESDSVKINLRKSRKLIQQAGEIDTDITPINEMLNDTLQGLGDMAELVENLLDFTRLDRAKVSEFDLNKGLRNIVYMARSVIPNEIELVEDYGNIPTITCNPSQLNQVFLNLINNAAEAIEHSGTIKIKSRPQNGQVRVEITDTGDGISDQDLNQIFDYYYTTKAASGGTGQGLAIAKNIVEEHGGSISLKSSVGIGTTFYITLPINADPGHLTGRKD